MVSALKGNFSTSESRVTQVIESRCEAALPYTVCWLPFRCAPRGPKPRLVSCLTGLKNPSLLGYQQSMDAASAAPLSGHLCRHRPVKGGNFLCVNRPAIA